MNLVSAQQSAKNNEDADAQADYVLYLYITGATQHSMMAVKNIKTICESHLSGRYSLHIIDIYQQPQLASQEDIIAVPTLIVLKPKPLRKLIGDLSDAHKILNLLGVNRQ